MAKPTAGFHTPRPSSLRSTAATSMPRCDLSYSAKALSSTTRSSAGSSSSASSSAADLTAHRDLVSVAKVVAKRLAYDDDFTFPAAASTLPEEGDLAPLLELSDPVSSSTVISASPDDDMTASANSIVTQVAAPTDSTADREDRAPLTEQRTEMELVLAELLGARGLSLRSKRLVVALVEVAAAELSPTTATARRLRRAAFWGKVRIGVLAATVFVVAAVDVALTVALLGARRGNGYNHHVLPPT